MNPHHEILTSVKAALELATVASPAISGLPAVQVRELPYVLSSVDVPPLCFVCPADGQGERVVKNLFAGQTWWGYPVVVLLIFAANRQIAGGLQGRLQLRHDVGERLFRVTLPGGVSVFDCDPDPRAAVEVQSALGTNYVVSGFLMTYKMARTRADYAAAR